MAWDRPRCQSWVMVRGHHCPLRRRCLCMLIVCALIVVVGRVVSWWVLAAVHGYRVGVGRGRLEFIGVGGRFGWLWHVGGGSLRPVIAVRHGVV
jgi:hypothetical protein